MKVVYAEFCDCATRELWTEGFEPVFLDDERTAIRMHMEAELRLSRGDGKRYFAFHVRGLHIMRVY